MDNNKFLSFDNCIFCGNELPSPELRLKKEGEHIFPRNIFGFWKSRDVCSECVKYFGKEIDKLPLKNEEIIKAMKILGLSKKDYIEGQKIEGEDLFNKSKVAFVVDKNKPRIKIINTNNRLQISEEMLKSLGTNWIRNNACKELDEKTINEEIIRFEKEYKIAKFGKSVINEKLGIIARKTQAEINNVKENSKSLRKLVAKIVVIFLYYFIPRDLNKIKELVDLENYVMDKGNLREHIIYRTKLFDSLNYEKYHFVKIDILEKFVNLSVVFFGRIGYSLPLSLTEKIEVCTIKDVIPIKSMVWRLDFEEKQKYVWELKNQNDILISREHYL